jgi:phosphoribosylamine---glycine ligase
LASRSAVGDADASATPEAAVTVVLAAGGYPETGDRGSVITGLDEAEAAGALVFQAGTAVQGDQLVTNGGRVLGVTGLGPSVADARSAAYSAADRITFEGARRREDIALAAAAGQVVTIPRPDPSGRV